VNEDCLKLTSYFGERARVGGSLLADALFEIYERHQLRASLLLRGAEGFGPKHHLRTDRLLSLSEDLPVVSVAVDRPDRIEAALAEVERLRPSGLVTLERARMSAAVGGPGAAPAGKAPAAAKLTIYLGRRARSGSRPAYLAAVDHLHRHGIEGSTVLLGVDGTLGGARQRARFFSANADVPMMVVAIGAGAALGAIVPELSTMLGNPAITLERVQVLKRDGRRLDALPTVPDTDASGLALWQKLILYAGEQTHFDGRPVHVEAVRRLRGAGAAGATALRGIWGYHGDHAPHGDSFWSLRRRVPTVTVVIDTPARTRRWFELLHRITPERGLITSEIVPAFRASTAGDERGGLRLAARHVD
jgi:PII-like signaling protein